MDNALGTLQRSKEAFARLIDETTVAYVPGLESLKAQVGTVETPDLYKQAHDMWESLGTSHPWKLLKEDPRFEQAVEALIQALLDDVVQRNDNLWASVIPLMNFNPLSMIKVRFFDAALGNWCNHVNPECADEIKCFLENFEKHPHAQDARNPNVNSKLRDMTIFVPEKTDTLREHILGYIEWRQVDDDEE
ncbi:MAG: hypothetical protein VX902_00810 [Planctomycetota bacterium]|nr:hypothetical protein [Planctomycetota bacterium]